VAKSEQEFYKPAEACRLAEVAPYVLRYWETEFPALAEGKEKGAAKLYSSRDVKIIGRIRELLYDEGFTVAGAKKRLEAEIVEGRFEDGLKTAPSPAEQKGKSRQSSVDSPQVAAPATADSAPVSRTELAEPAFIAEAPAPAAAFPERKRVVKELKEIVRILGREKKR
jgi:DNA-binding transcriptional MerR regulator